ncbi:hypothetical protein BS47DRAFT_1259224, partial [Hydnum rufescens UP504]
VIEYHTLHCVHKPFDTPMSGFSELIPQELINTFNELIDYQKYKMNNEVIHWSWQVTQSWSTEHKSWPPQFATGMSQI